MDDRYRRGDEPRLLSGHAFGRLLRRFGNSARGGERRIGGEISPGRNDSGDMLGRREEAGRREMAEAAVVAIHAVVRRRGLMLVYGAVFDCGIVNHRHHLVRLTMPAEWHGGRRDGLERQPQGGDEQRQEADEAMVHGDHCR